MDKELMLVTSYCDTTEKKEILLECLKSLQPFRNDYSIFLTSHLPLDNFFYDYIDYFYYDKNNYLITDPKTLEPSWFSPNQEYTFIVYSIYTNKLNTLGSIWSMFIPSIQAVKSLGYKKIHYLEYDSIINNIDEFKDNSKLLNDYDYCLYEDKRTTHNINGSIFSFNVDKVINELMSFNINQIESLFHEETKVPENVFFNLVKRQRKFYLKSFESISENGVHCSKITGQSKNWNVPFYDTITHKIMFLSWNTTDSIYDIKIIVNDLYVFKIENLNPGHWVIKELIGDVNDLQSLLVIKNNQVTLDLKFDDEKRNEFIKYNRSEGKL